MKLSNLKTELQNKINKPSHIRDEYKHRQMDNKSSIDNKSLINDDSRNVLSYNNNQQINNLSEINKTTNNIIDDNGIYNIDDIIIIGITGSKGKSSTAYTLHKAILSMGYKSILYSSIMVDSPASYKLSSDACELPLRNEATLLDIINEAEYYQAKYIVLEINESTIKSGLTKNIPFNIRALTNLNPTHNLEQYTKEEYVALKKSFFIDIPSSDNCTCIFGMTGDFTRDSFNELLNINNHPKRTYGTKYICEVFNADYTNIDYLLYDMKHDLNGLDLKLRIKDQTTKVSTPIILPHNCLNIMCVIAILDTLNIYNEDNFNKCMKTISLPGREEIIKFNNVYIIIGLSLIPALEIFKGYQDQGIINNIKVVDGSHGSGYIGWGNKYQGEEYKQILTKNRRFACNYLKKYANYVYLTSNDPGNEDPYIIASELQNYLDNTIPSIIETDRKKAIRQAIIDANDNDIIYIAGRGNRRVFCDSKDDMKLFTDKEIVMEIIKSLNRN